LTPICRFVRFVILIEDHRDRDYAENEFPVGRDRETWGGILHLPPVETDAMLSKIVVKWTSCHGVSGNG